MKTLHPLSPNPPAPPASADFKKPHLSFVLKRSRADWLEGDRCVTRHRLPAENAERCEMWVQLQGRRAARRFPFSFFFLVGGWWLKLLRVLVFADALSDSARLIAFFLSLPASRPPSDLIWLLHQRAARQPNSHPAEWTAPRQSTPPSVEVRMRC